MAATLSATLTLPVFMVYNQQYMFMVKCFTVHATSTKLASGKPVPNNYGVVTRVVLSYYDARDHFAD